MASRIYINRSTDTLREYRSGTVSPKINGVYKANQRYHRFTASASGRKLDGSMVLTATDPLITAATIPDSARNSLYRKVVDELQGPKGELLTTTVEWKTSLDMISNRARTLHRAYKALRVFDLPGVAYHLSLTEKQRKLIEGRVKRKNHHPGPTGLWLEYWMGWAPLHGDIAHAVNTLSKPPPDSEHFSVGSSFEGNPWKKTIGKPTGSNYTRDECRLRGRITAYGDVKVTNHNLLLANQLGFVNPALTAWQVIPFSFIVDWFVNVGQVVGSLTDFVGLGVSNTGISYLLDYNASRSGHTKKWDSELKAYQTLYYSGGGKRSERIRTPAAIPTPVINFQLPKLSKSRAATSISLLTEIFLRK